MLGKMGLRDQNNGTKIGINGSRIYHVTTLTSGGVGHFGTWLRPWQNVPVDRRELVTVFCSIGFRWSPWLFSLINMLSSLARIANRFWGMNEASLLINSLQARSILMRRLTVLWPFLSENISIARMIMCLSFHLIILKLYKSSWSHKAYSVKGLKQSR